jgi:hypothetical protein
MTRPPIDPELEPAISDLLGSDPALVNATLADIPRIRRSIESEGLDATTRAANHGIEVEEHRVPGPADAPDLLALVVRPAGACGPLPCLYLTWNGGKIIRDHRRLTDLELGWVTELGLTIVSIAGRVGPEDRHPALAEDAYAGLVWIAENAQTLGVDPHRLLVYGKSGGGGVAAAVALMARDRRGPPLSHQVLVYPMIDDRGETESSTFDGIPWNAATNRMAWGAYLGETRGGPDVSPYAAAARATELEGLPPAYLETGSSEVFRDEILDYACRLARAGVPIELHSWAGAFHASEIAAPTAQVSLATIAARTSYVRRALRTASGAGEARER